MVQVGCRKLVIQRSPEWEISTGLQTAGDGRVPKITNDRIVEAKPKKSRLRVGPLWRNPMGGFGSVALSEQWPLP
jgi:hypothetical protein